MSVKDRLPAFVYAVLGASFFVYQLSGLSMLSRAALVFIVSACVYVVVERPWKLSVVDPPSNPPSVPE